MTWGQSLPLVALLLEAMREPVAARWAASGGWRVSLPRQGFPSRPGAALRGLLRRCWCWGWGFGVMVMMVPAVAWEDARAAYFRLHWWGIS